MPCVLRVLCAALCGALLLAVDAPVLLALETTATYYHPSLHGGVMANGERYNRWNPEIAACNWYPLGTVLKVTRRGSEAHVYVQVKDRGSPALTLDLSEGAFQRLGHLPEGRIAVLVEVVTVRDAPELLELEPLEPERGVPDSSEPWPFETAPPELPLLGAIQLGS
jgi:rare lipoprotein A (peptidoglycan hydrolase)